ncbi:hypothetical protein SBA7_1660011 [Candidatus Sulfotelmatobacter sp. SbA7]|nr:hypothetical protein SBA7_1660011 [Candidatus Sulfotelmatobacter sp. SbA7]
MPIRKDSAAFASWYSTYRKPFLFLPTPHGPKVTAEVDRYSLPRVKANLIRLGHSVAHAFSPSRVLMLPAVPYRPQLPVGAG